MNFRMLGAVVSVPLFLAACGGGETTTSSTGGGGSGGGSTGGGGTTSSPCDACPAGSHELADCTCEAELTGWMAGPLLGSSRDHHVSFIASVSGGNFLYAGTGASSIGSALATFERSAIAEDGSLGAFEKVEPLPVGILGAGFAQVDNGFVLGGGLLNDGNSTADTWVGAVAEDGSLSFTAGPPLTVDRYHLTLLAAKGFVFAIGGLQQAVSGGTPTQTVLDVIERATFDGETLSAFEQIGTFPVKTTHHTAFFHGDALYVFGGGSGAAATTDILRATVSDAGELGTWETVGQLPEARATASAQVFLEQLYVFAGMKSLVDEERDTVLRAPIGTDGSVAMFTELPALPKARAHTHQTPMLNGFFYSVGGSIHHVPQKDSFISKLE